MPQLSEIIPYLLTYRYVGIFIANYLTSAVVPLPDAAVLLIVGTLSHKQYFNVFLAFPIAVLAMVFGDTTGYLFARLFGTHERRTRYHEKSRVFRLIEKYLKKHPFSTVIISRFVGFTTTAANLTSGFTKMPLGTFVLADLIGNALCAALYLGIGYTVGSIWGQSNLLSLVGTTILVFAGIYAAIMIPFYLLRDRSKKS